MYFLDSTFIVALFVLNDPWHSQSLEVYEKIKNHKLIKKTIKTFKNKQQR